MARRSLALRCRCSLPECFCFGEFLARISKLRKKRSHATKRFRAYLLVLQSLTTTLDVFWGVAFAPVPLVPAIGRVFRFLGFK